MGWDGSQFDGLRAHIDNLVTPTLRGRTLDAMVDEAAAHVHDGDLLGGVSMGAAVSLAYAARPDARCSAIALIAPAGGDDARRYLDWLADTLESGGFDALRAAGEPLVDMWESRFGRDHLLALWRTRPFVDVAAVRVPSVVVAWRGDGVHPWDEAASVAAQLDAPLVEVPAPTSTDLPAAEITAAIAPLLRFSSP